MSENATLPEEAKKVTFLSSKAALRIVLQPETLDYIPVEGGRFHRKRVKGKTAEFEPISPATDGFIYHGTSLPTKGGRIRGRFETKDPEIIAMLMNHRSYGNNFIAVSPDGRELVGDDKLFMDLDDGSVVFLPTGRIFKNRAGAEGFKQSNEYKETVDKWRDQALSQISS